MRLNEFDNDKLAQYKTAAAADAAKADAEGDYKRGDKRFKGINNATKKQFANDAKKSQQKKFEMNEVAPPGDKAERMVRHIKQGYAKDGKLTPREKGIAYATAWKAHNAGQVEEQGVTEGSGQKPTITYKDLTLQYDYRTEDDDPEGYSTATTYYFDVFKDGNRVGEAEYFDYFGNLKIRIHGKTKEFGFRHPLASQISQLVSSLPDEQKKDLSDPKFESQGVAEGQEYTIPQGKEYKRGYAAAMRGEPYDNPYGKDSARTYEQNQYRQGYKAGRKERQGVTEGSIKDVEAKIKAHDQRKADREQAGDPYVAHELHSHNVIRKQLLDKRKRAQAEYHKKMDQRGVAEGSNNDYQQGVDDGVEYFLYTDGEGDTIKDVFLQMKRSATEHKSKKYWRGVVDGMKSVQSEEQVEQGVAEGSTSHAELAKMAHDAYVAASRKGNGPMAAHYLKQYQKHKADTAKVTKGVAEGHADQQRKIFKKNGQPVGEVGIDRESSPGVGQWYMKCYAYDIDNSGYDSYEEAVAELKHCLKQGVTEESVDDFLARGGKIQQGKTHKPRKAERWQGSSHIGAAGGKGSKGTVSGMAANTDPKGGKPVVTAEDSLAAMRRLAGVVPQAPAIVPNGPRQYRHMPTAVQPR